jgi:predicted RNA-binding Zn ribbon-like protein
MTAPHTHGAPNGLPPNGLPKHEFLAGRVALDFCNSLSRMRRVGPPDRILKPADFQGWAGRCGFVLDRAPNPQALARLHALRAALFGIFDTLLEQREPKAADLEVLNAELTEARAAERLVPAREGYAIEDAAPAIIDRFRHAVVRDAAGLLIGDRRRIKRCPRHDCLWLFYDGSKNLSRRWCAMDDCGTLEKVQRYRKRAE